MDYPQISDHGLIGDLQTAALVTKDGEIDWFCAPRFDSPSIFASLLDRERGGQFTIAPTEPGYVSRQLYLPDTAVLITRFLTAGGVGELLDFMPIADTTRPTDRHRLVRVLRVVRGEMRFAVEFTPRFDYGRASHTVEVTGDGAIFRAGDQRITLHPARTVSWDGAERITDPRGDGIRGTATLKAGQVGAVMMETGDGDPPHRLARDEITSLLDDTVRYWRRWLARSTYTGRWREQVRRSAMTLKLMTYAPSGAVVAAPTAGLPEQIGGERNWDYRFTWIRDASFSVYALLGLGYVEEARSFVGWLANRIEEQAGDASGPLKIMYRVDGSSDLSEETLDHFEGYMGSAPVRIGNGASDQLQLDIYGEAMDSIYFADRHGVALGHARWNRVVDMLDWLCDHWDSPEEGIWETRGGRQNFTYGRINSWAAFDRAIRLAAERARPGKLQRWATERDRVYRQVMDRGWNDKRQAFVQHYDTDVLDASLLRMVQVGFVVPDDPMWLSTLNAMDSELVSDSLVYRYNPEASPDGLRGSEGTFSLCTFWYVDALARSGRLEEAGLIFEKMHTYANPLGLYSEEIGLTGEQLGNFPQAFTHLALINAAVNLNRQLDASYTSDARIRD
ncbi:MULTISPECIES: glycoside hydrolase family 15 protein [unclassified Frankia]|uniref:glycoside hydrolase family 15 protein n=1 Tax=unclassified Frankia TaxID=2632575 RepID=UPI002AD26412|nr:MULTISPECIES: glycoside hydrolase family 15 protein [unclassified Frankia]